jgi:hypothetical protein
LKRAEADFDLLITADQNIVYQQNLSGQTIAILELSTNNLRQLQTSAILIQNAIDALGPGDLVRLDIPSTSVRLSVCGGSRVAFVAGTTFPNLHACMWKKQPCTLMILP